MLYTRKGDTGTSGLFGTKERFPKNNPVYHALGTLDELNSLLGLCYAKAAASQIGPLPMAEVVRTVQQHLFIAQAELAGAEKKLTQQQVEYVEDAIAQLENQIEHPAGFLIAGATELSALFDYARAVSRRAERSVIEAGSIRAVSPATSAYVNRISSLLYALARYAAAQAGAEEASPAY